MFCIRKMVSSYTIKVQYDDKFIEIDFELVSADKKHMIITDKMGNILSDTLLRLLLKKKECFLSDCRCDCLFP